MSIESFAEDAWRRIRRRLAVFSPRRRRWLRFLEGLSADPDRLERPVPEPGPRDFMICGVPRSGTTLLTAMLYQPPGVVTVMEPWDGMRLAPAELFSSLRDEIDRTQRLRRGKLDLGKLREDGRVEWCREGDADVPLGGLDADYALGIKWPVFWRYLELLPGTRFVVCVRHPAAVINSFKRQTGGLREGQMYDIAFNRKINAAVRAGADDPELRRVLLYAYISERIRPFLSAPNVYVAHYERWFEEPRAMLAEVASFLEVPLPDIPVRLNRPPGLAGISPREAELIREHARVAEAFGYGLESMVKS